MNVKGSCYVLLAYDIGFQINLEECAKLLTVETARLSIAPRQRAPKHFDYRSKPLRLTQRVEAFGVSGFMCVEFVDLTLFEFGAVSLQYRFPFDCELGQLVELSDALYDNKLLRADSEKRVVELMLSIQSAVSRPSIAPSVEDYVVFDVTSRDETISPDAVVAGNRLTLAKILQSEKASLSEQEVGSTLTDSLSYTTSDLAIVGWNSALLFGDDSSDLRSVLEFANVQLLEHSYLDLQLDGALDKAYELVLREDKPSWRLLHSIKSDMRRVARLQVDAALLFEGLSNSLKLLGDQYLARAYQLAAKKFHISDWDRSITRKLAVLDSIYKKLEDRSDSVRMELLELVIIVLILVSILLPFVISTGK
jgi:hypothetical protein